MEAAGDAAGAKYPTRIRKPESTQMFKGAPVIVIGAVVLTACGTTETGQTSAPVQTEQKSIDLTASQIAEVKRVVSAKLKDPGSAKFGEIRASVDNRGSVGICGIVNAKNSHGGYIGNHPFAAILADGKVAHVIMDSPSDPTKVAREACRNIAPSLTW
jgi:hypothetical protein